MMIDVKLPGARHGLKVSEICWSVSFAPRCGGMGMTFVAPSESHRPVPAYAICIMLRAKCRPDDPCAVPKR